jgi:Cu(I)/Ag(I) efflux system membrane fusion protein
MKTKMMKITLAALLLGGMSVLPVEATVVNTNKADVTLVAPAVKSVHTQFTVKGNCELCKARIEKAAKSVKGVKMAMWEQKTKLLHLQYDPSATTPKTVMQAIAKAGHDAGSIKASTAAYKALPSCCQYKR